MTTQEQYQEMTQFLEENKELYEKYNEYLIACKQHEMMLEITKSDRIKKLIEVLDNKYNLINNDRYRDYVIARQYVFFLLRKIMKLTYKSIGEIFGKDHATVIYGIKKTQEKLEVRDSLLLEVKPQIDHLFEIYLK